MSENGSDAEKKLFEAIEKNDVLLLKTLLTEIKNVNIVDENSMTPLQHAAYKGNKEIVQLLLDQVSELYCKCHGLLESGKYCSEQNIFF